MQWNLNDNSPSWEREGVCLKKKALCKRTYLQGRCGAYINLTLGPNWMAAGSSRGHRADPRQALAELGEKGQSLQSNGKAVSKGEESSTLPKHAHLWRMGPSTQLARKAASLGDLSCSERRSETTICASLCSERYAYTSSISPLKCRSPAHVIATWKTQEELFFFLSRKKKHMFLGLCKNNQDKSSHKEKKSRGNLYSLCSCRATKQAAFTGWPFQMVGLEREKLPMLTLWTDTVSSCLELLLREENQNAIRFYRGTQHPTPTAWFVEVYQKSVNYSPSETNTGCK